MTGAAAASRCKEDSVLGERHGERAMLGAASDDCCQPAPLPACSTASFKALERAAVRMAPPGKRDRWLVTLTEVEELK